MVISCTNLIKRHRMPNKMMLIVSRFTTQKVSNRTIPIHTFSSKGNTSVVAVNYLLMRKTASQKTIKVGTASHKSAIGWRKYSK